MYKKGALICNITLFSYLCNAGMKETEVSYKDDVPQYVKTERNTDIAALV
jgi:hypothetical protein